MGSPSRHVASSARASRRPAARSTRHRPGRGPVLRAPVAVWVAAVAVLALVAGPLGVAPAAGEPSPADRPVVDAAVAWLSTQQQADGGFEVAGFPGFETPDAVLALAEAAQTAPGWDDAAARTAVAAVTTGGKDPLDALDVYASSGLDTGQAAKLVVLVAEPLGLDPRAFDPAADGGPVDLVALVEAGANPDGTYGSPAAFTQTLQAALALYLAGGSVLPSTVAAVEARQQANGGWNFAGDASGTDVDPDTTGLAVQALVAGGAGSGDPAVVAALGLLADGQRPDGSWASPFDSGNPNSTAMAMLAIAAAGFDPDAPCWRDVARPSTAGGAYASPSAYLRSIQAPDGHLVSPNDGFPPVNTFATSQGVEGLSRGWLPVEVATAPACPGAPLGSGGPAGPSASGDPSGAPDPGPGTAPAAVPVSVRPAFTG